MIVHVIGETASTHASLTGVALVIGLSALALLILLELPVRVRRTFASPVDEQQVQGQGRIKNRISRTNYVLTYGAWIIWTRIVLSTVGILGLLVAGIAALA